MSDVNTGH